jgi:hypothetical protein
MATATARAPKPCNEKGRPVAGRPFIQLFCGEELANTAALRFQRLRLLGIIGHRANIVAELAWGSQ